MGRVGTDAGLDLWVGGFEGGGPLSEIVTRMTDWTRSPTVLRIVQLPSARGGRLHSPQVITNKPGLLNPI